MTAESALALVPAGAAKVISAVAARVPIRVIIIEALAVKATA
jgi:hypothetical protein